MTWMMVDIDKLDPPVYDRISKFEGAFQHPVIPVLLVPFDMLNCESGTRRLVAAGAPPNAIHITEKRG